MPYNIFVFIPRKAGISHEDFKQHLETIHMPLLQFYGGERFPKHHKRHYLQFDKIDQPTIIRGTAAGFDAISEASFADEAAFHAFLGALKVEDASKVIRADEEKFCNVEKLSVIVVGDVREIKV
jgi:hypothetical protein